MFRANILGKVGYFENDQQVSDFVFERLARLSNDEVLADLRLPIEVIKRDWLNLKSFNTKRLDKRYLWKNNVGIKIANFFMGFRWLLYVKDKKAPFDEIRIKKSLDYIVKSYFILQRTNNLTDFQDIIDKARIRGGAQELNNFPPVVAKTLYETYCPAGGAILDFSAGFGGRLVGAMSSKNNYSYVGVDPSTKAVVALEQLIDFLNVRGRAKIIPKPFEDCDEDLKNDSFDYCFTSPPYFTKEIYANEPTQSVVRYPEIEAWRVGFLKKSFEIIRKKLKHDCLLMVNISDIKMKTGDIKLTDMVIKTAEEVGFVSEGFRKMLIGNRFSSFKKKAKARREFNFEKIFVFVNKKS